MREAYSRFKNIALLWSIGKDSSCLLYIAQKAFFGKIPLNDTEFDVDPFQKEEKYYLKDSFKTWILKRWKDSLL